MALTYSHALFASFIAIAFTSVAQSQPCAYLYENPSWYTVTTPRSVKAVDLNGDGAPDIITAGRRNELSVQINAGDGSMLPPVVYATDTGTEDLAIGDLNGDEFPDFAIANLSARTIQTYINDGTGAFTLRDTLSDPLNVFNGVAIGDPNNDGLGDLLGIQSSANFLQLYLALPEGGYDTPVMAFLVNSPTHAEFGDANGNGLLDIFMVASDASTPASAPGIMAVFLNGGFDPETGDWLNYNALAISNPMAMGAPADVTDPMIALFCGGLVLAMGFMGK